MKLNTVFGNSMSMSEKSLDFLWKKQQVTMENIANVDTPGYKAKYVTFEETFRSRLQAAAGNSDAVKNAIGNSSYQVHSTDNESARLDGNSVNQEAEMVELTRTALQYQYGLNAVNSDIMRLRTAVKGQ